MDNLFFTDVHTATHVSDTQIQIRFLRMVAPDRMFLYADYTGLTSFQTLSISKCQSRGVAED